MKMLDFLSTLPAEEKEFFVNVLEETGSINYAVMRTMMVLSDSEPGLAKQLEGPVRRWLKIIGPILPGDEADFDWGMSEAQAAA